MGLVGTALDLPELACGASSQLAALALKPAQTSIERLSLATLTRQAVELS
jgi:hypothetical protein